MAKVALIVLGIILIIITFFVLETGLRADEGKIRTINSFCTLNIGVYGFNVPLGEIGQTVLGAVGTDVPTACRNAKYAVLLLDWGWIGYVLGGLLLILGIVISGRKSHRKEESYSKNEEDSSHHEETHSSKSRFCGNCGSKLGGYEKHCHNCGKKV